MDVCRNVSVSGEYQQEQVLSPPCSKLGGLSTSLDDLFSAQNTVCLFFLWRVLRILLISFLLSADLWRCPHQFLLFASTFNLKFHYIIVFSSVSPFFCSLCLLGFTLLYLLLLILFWLSFTPIILIGITNMQHILIVIWALLILGVLFSW